MQLLDILTAPWAIAPAKLLEIQAIYATHLRGEKIDIAAVEARLQRPLANDQQMYVMQDGGVAVLTIEGVIAPKANLFTQISGGASAQLLQKQVESAMADTRVRALVLSIDSPGGSVFGSPELATTIREAAKQKPIVAVSDGMMASAAYWVGSAANAVFISGLTVQVGSIGVVATHNYNPRAGGSQVSEVSAGRYKRIASTNAPLTQEGRDYLQAQVDHVYSVFVDAVAEHRGVSAESVLEHMADGRVFTGQQAIDAGLVDGVATVDAIVEQLAANPAAFIARRKAVVASAAPLSESAGAAPADATSQSGDPSMPITREQLAAEAPEVLKAILAEGSAAGAASERSRIQAVHALLAAGNESIVTPLMFDGKSTDRDAAFAIVNAEKAQRAAQAVALASDAPAPLPQKPATTVAAEPSASAAAEKKSAVAAAQAAVPAGYSVDADKALLDAKARAYMAAHPDVSYLAAVKAVQKEI